MTHLPPGPELDALVAEKVMGWRWGELREFWGWINGDGEQATGMVGQDGSKPPTPTSRQAAFQWSPSTRIQDAWEVVEKLGLIGYRHEDGYRYWLGRDVQEESPFWCLYREEGAADETWVEEASPRGVSAPHAICLAALEAVP